MAGAVGLVLLFLVTQGIAIVLVTLAAKAIGADFEFDFGALTAPQMLALTIVQLIQLGLALALAYTFFGFRAVGLRPPTGGTRRAWRALIPVGLVLLVPGILVAAGSGELIDPDVRGIELAVVVLLAFAIGASEELWFRGLLIAQLGAQARPWLVIIFSSLLFGVPHITNEPASLLNAAGVTLAIGIPFAVVRLVTDALLPLIVVHGIIDVWAFAHTGSATVEGSPSAAEVVGTLVLPAVLAVAYVLWYRGARPSVAADRPAA